MHKVQEFAELLSNGLSIPVIGLSLCVVLMWWKPALESLRNFKLETAEQWFITGVFFGFTGELFDNLYWTVGWAFLFFDHPISSDIISFGVFSNIPFRQLMGIIAAYCHIRSALQYTGRSHVTRPLHALLIGCGILGIIYTCTLVFIKHTLYQ